MYVTIFKLEVLSGVEKRKWLFLKIITCKLEVTYEISSSLTVIKQPCKSSIFQSTKFHHIKLINWILPPLSPIPPTYPHFVCFLHTVVYLGVF